MQTPRQVDSRADGLGISRTQRLGIAHLDIDNLTYSTTFYNIENFLKIRKIPSIVSHKARHACLLRDAIDAGTIFIARCQRFLHIDGFAGFHGHDSIGGVTRRRCGDIHGIDIGIVDEFLGISIPFGDAMLHGIGPGATLRTAHDSRHARAFHLAEGRAAFGLHDLTATDESPLQLLHTI